LAFFAQLAAASGVHNLSEECMRAAIMLVAAVVLFLFMTAPANAQWWENKWEITPFAGYETSGSYPVTPTLSSIGVADLRVNAATSYGGFLDYSLSRNFQAEFMFDRNDTSYSDRVFGDPNFTHAFSSHVNQFQFGGLYMLLGPSHRLRPYVAGSIGFTHEANGDGAADRTDFAFSVGGGVKYFLTSHIGLRADATFMPTYANSSLATFCDPFFGCFTGRVSNYQDRGNFVGGVIFRF
jgi:Outer membrane protein beta-barrel domain